MHSAPIVWMLPKYFVDDWKNVAKVQWGTSYIYTIFQEKLRIIYSGVVGVYSSLLPNEPQAGNANGS